MRRKVKVFRLNSNELVSHDWFWNCHFKASNYNNIWGYI